jgi:hypothetical protein
MRAGFWVSLTALALSGATAAQASVTIYDNRAAWEAAAGNATDTAIPDPFTPSDFLVIGAGQVSVEYDSVTYLQAAGFGSQQLAVYGATFTGGPALISSRNLADPGAPNIAITLPSSVTAFAMNYGNEQGETLNLDLSNSFTQSLTSAPGEYTAPGFFGIVDTDPFDEVFLTTSSGWLNVNQVSYTPALGLPSPIPESSTWIMMMGGLAALAALARCSRPRVI